MAADLLVDSVAVLAGFTITWGTGDAPVQDVSESSADNSLKEPLLQHLMRQHSY